jgi:hypothetical protein
MLLSHDLDRKIGRAPVRHHFKAGLVGELSLQVPENLVPFVRIRIHEIASDGPCECEDARPGVLGLGKGSARAQGSNGRREEKDHPFH